MTTKSAGQRRTPARRPVARHDGDTEARILDAAHVVFVRRGTAGARMHDIARQAGVNPALLHYYFRSKKKLAEAVFRRVVQSVIPPVIRVMGSDATLEEKIRQVVHLYLDNLARSPDFPGYFMAELNQQPERAGQLFEALTGLHRNILRTSVRARLRAQIREGVRAGTLRPTSVDDLIITITSLCIFPFVARPMYAALLGTSEAAFRRIMRRRRDELPDFILRALRP